MAALEPVIAEYMKREPAHLVTPVLLDILTGYGEKIICSVNAGGAMALTVTIASPSQQLQRHRLQSANCFSSRRIGKRFEPCQQLRPLLLVKPFTERPSKQFQF